MKPSDLIADVRNFTTGTLARDSKGNPCGTGPDSGAVAFDCLGALLWCIPDALERRPPPDKEHPGKDKRSVSRELFDLCQARHGHKRLGRLDHSEAVDLLRSVGA